MKQRKPRLTPHELDSWVIAIAECICSAPGFGYVLDAEQARVVLRQFATEHDKRWSSSRIEECISACIAAIEPLPDAGGWALDADAVRKVLGWR